MHEVLFSFGMDNYYLYDQVNIEFCNNQALLDSGSTQSSCGGGDLGRSPSVVVLQISGHSFQVFFYPSWRAVGFH